MKILLVLSLCLLPTPFLGVGVAGLISWALMSLLFSVADVGEEKMSEEISNGNAGCGRLWLILVFVLVALGGVVVLGSFFAVAAELRGVRL